MILFSVVEDIVFENFPRKGPGPPDPPVVGGSHNMFSLGVDQLLIRACGLVLFNWTNSFTSRPKAE